MISIHHDALNRIDAFADAVSKAHDSGNLAELQFIDFTQPPLNLTPEEYALRAGLRDLHSDELAELFALMWLGRGDGDPSDWAGLMNDAKEAINEGAVDYLAGKVHLADDLRKGLQKISSDG